MTTSLLISKDSLLYASSKYVFVIIILQPINIHTYIMFYIFFVLFSITVQRF